MADLVLAILAGIFATYTFTLVLLQRTQDTDEPPAIDTSIPFVSPILAMGWRGYLYWSPRSQRPMYTLRLPFVRLYVVNSPRLVQIVQRQVRTISFAPILVRMASTVMAVSPDAARIVSENHLSDHGFVHGITHAIRPALSPGPKLDALNRKAAQTIATSLDKAAGDKTASRVNLVELVYHHVVMATTEGVYGPQNPFRDSAVQKAFFIYEQGFVRLMINILPNLIAYKSAQARSVMGSALRRYFDEAGYEDPDASALIKAKYEFCAAMGISKADTARMEVASSIALLSNTMPATFWLIFHLYSDPELLDSCRAELSHAIRESDDARTIDLACVRNRCPLLFSTFQEVLRFYGIGISTRVVLEDTVLDGRFRVKKGGVVFIPGAAHHRLRSVWGENADEFFARRFLQPSGKTGMSYDPAAFRAFGGGSTLCPGRHFAATEILAFASLIVLRFDAQPLGGRWIPPTTGKTTLGTTIRQPDYGVEVELRVRDDHKWTVQFSESEETLADSS